LTQVQCGKIKITPVEVIALEEKGLGDRCCIDLTSYVSEGLGLPKNSGLVVGSSSKGLFLIHAENIENPFVSQRPFRVNAGAVSMYTLVPPCDKDGKYSTKYLCELKPGDAVVVADYKGNVAEAIVGRNKVERRPLTLIKAIHPTLKNPYTDSLDYIDTFVQNAETTNLIDALGKPIQLKKLKRGDKILACTENPHPIARHFGTPVNATKIFENPYFAHIP
jgi:3-dehydroquinate synthase II